MLKKRAYLKGAALIAWCLVFLPRLASAGELRQSGSGDAQRVELISQQGGLLTGALPLGDSTVVAAEGGALVRLAIAPGGSSVLARRELGHGAIVDLARCGDGMCALTVEGVVTLSGASGDGMPATAGFAPGGGQAMATQGDLVVIAARQAGVRILRVGPGGVTGAEVTVPVAGDAIDVALDRADNRVYVAAGQTGVISVDLTDPPTAAGTLDTVRPADSVALVGKLLAIGSGKRVVMIDPAAGGQAAVGQYAPLTQGQRMVIDGDYAYVADAHDGLKILWLTAPDRPVQLFSEADRPAMGVAVDKDTAYVVGADGLRVYDVSSRYRPLPVATLALPATPLGITLADTRAFIALGDQGIAVVDVANQAAPQITHVIPLGGPASASAFSGGTLYAAAGSAGLAVIDAQTPGQEALLSTLPLPGPALDIGARADAVYVTAGEAGLVSVDISRRQLPVIASVLPPGPGQHDQTITISGKRGYVTQGDRFIIADVSHPKSMGILGTVRDAAAHIAASDIYLYALNADSIAIYDARATAEPVYLRAYRSMRRPARITMDGARALVTSAEDGPDVVVLDLTAPDAPAELDNEGETGHTYRADSSQGSVLLAAGLAGLRAYTLTEGGALAPQGSYDTLADTAHLAASGGRLAAGGLQGWALSDLQSATTLQMLPGLAARALALDGDTAAVSTEDGALAIYAIGQGGTAKQIARKETSAPASGLAIADGFVFAAAPDGLSIYDRRNLTRAQRLDLPSPPQGVAVAGGVAYLPLTDGSMAIVDIGDPAGGIRTIGTAPTARPAALFRGPDGAIYALADTLVSRLALGDLAHPAAITVGQLPQVGVKGAFVSDLMVALTPGEALRLYDPKQAANGAIPFYGEIPTTAVDFAPGWPLSFAAYGDGGLGTIDLPNRQVGLAFFTEPVTALAQDGTTLLAAGSSLTAWDISQPDQPRQIATLALDFRGRHIDAAPGGNWLISTDSGLTIAHLEGGSLSTIGSVTLTGPADRAIQIGTRGYAALHDGGLVVLDLSDPTHPTSLFTLTSGAGTFVSDLFQLDATHLLVSWEGGIDVLDIGSPAAPPQLASTFLLGAEANGIRITADGKHAALSMGEQGAEILDLSDPHHPQLAAQVGTAGQALAAEIDGGTLYIADGTCGLRVFDVSTATSPRETGYWRGGYASDVLVLADGSPQPAVVLASGSQVTRLRYNPAGPAVPPPSPQNPDPPADDSSAPVALTLKWGPPPDPCDPLTYDVYFGQEDNPPRLGSVTGEPHIEVPQLAPHGAYTWHVDVTDRQGDQISGPVWHFTTSGADFPNVFPPSPPLFLAWIEDHPLVSAGLIGLFLAIPGLLLLRGLRQQSGLGLPRGRSRRETEIPEWYEGGRDAGEDMRGEAREEDADQGGGEGT